MEIKVCNPNFFIVKISKEEQLKTELNGSFYMAQTYMGGFKSLQHGEIISIGKLAHMVLPEAKIGHTLLFSWKVEYSGNNINKSIIGENEQYRYHTVTIAEYKGRDMECFGYYDGEKIITHPSFVFLEPQQEEKSQEKTTTSGIIFYDNWHMTESEILQKIEFNTNNVKSLANTHAMQTNYGRESEARQTKEKIDSLEKENLELSKLYHKKEVCEPRTVSCCNPLQDLENGLTIYSLNIFNLEVIKFMGKQYNICKYKNIDGVYRNGKLVPFAAK